MTLSRRDFTILSAGAAAGLALPRRLLALGGAHPAGPGWATTQFDWREVGQGAWVAMGLGGNVLLLDGGGEALLVDCKHVGLGVTLRREAEGQGVRLAKVLTTHHHRDHSGGMAAFTLDLPLLAHPNAAPRLRAQGEQIRSETQRLAGRIREMVAEEGGQDSGALAEIDEFIEQASSLPIERFLPSATIAEADEITVGSEILEVYYVSPGHTDNDLHIYSRQRNLLHTGDLYFNGRHPFIDVPAGATTLGWQRCIQQMLELCDDRTVVIPGHGDLSGREGLRGQFVYFELLRRVARLGIQEGRSRDEVTAFEPAEFAELDGSPGRNLGIVYDELAG